MFFFSQDGTPPDFILLRPSLPTLPSSDLFCNVFDENDRKVTPRSVVPVFIALMGAIPAVYYKDPEKSAKTFRTIDGVRYSIPGDWCTVEADGSLTLLGRGSV